MKYAKKKFKPPIKRCKEHDHQWTGFHQTSKGVMKHCSVCKFVVTMIGHTEPAALTALAEKKKFHQKN